MLGRPFLGGRRHTVYTDDEGNFYIAGETQSSDFPTGAVEDGKWVNPLQEKFGGGGLDGFAAKLSPTGKLMYSTYLGGRGTDTARDITVDDEGHAYVTGGTEIENRSVPFVIKLDTEGREIYSFIPTPTLRPGSTSTAATS